MLPSFARGRFNTLAAILIFLLFLVSHSMASAQSDDFADEDCLSCHEGVDVQLARTAHRLSSTINKPFLEIRCVSCHSGADTHFDDPGRGTIGNPAKLDAVDERKLCTSCHDPHTEAATVGFDVHIGLDLSCSSCHSVHGTNDHLLIDKAGDYCGTCHVAVVNEFRKRSNHPLADGNVGCVDCHSFTPANEPDFGHGGSVNCYGCHPQQGGPYLFEHEATSSFSPEGVGCVACHTPHGSSNERLLTQPDDRLCMQCHAAPPGHLTAHGGDLAGYACMDCHSEIHGSYDNLFLLDPQLGSKLANGPDGCFCHYYR